MSEIFIDEDVDAKLNSQGMSRRCKSLMSSIVAPAGRVFVSVDLSAGEPTITSHYSHDANFTYANFTGVGKKPKYVNHILMLDDMYLMGASVSPTGQQQMLDLYHTTFKGVSFRDQWVEDREVITKDPAVKTLRGFHKTMVLAMQYGQMPKGMVSNAHDNGHNLDLGSAKRFHHAFWYDLFPDVRRLGERLQAMVKRDGYLVNDFGFRLFPRPARKSLNYFIQSSVSGVMDVLAAKFYSACPDAIHCAIIHDELIFSVSETLIQEAEVAMGKAVESLNKDLGWSVKIRTGWAVGKDFYEAH